MPGGSGGTLDSPFTITRNPRNSPEARDLEQAVHDAAEKEGRDSVPKYIPLEAHDQEGKTIVDTPLDNPAHPLGNELVRAEVCRQLEPASEPRTAGLVPGRVRCGAGEERRSCRAGSHGR
jgi:hypothetical protein